jgi:O-antigen/teichoic acid export membrane protein
MRTKLSIRNIYISIFSQVIIALLGFIARKVFLDSLGANYLGINGLLTNVLSALVLVEGGIAISIVYNLYKPLAEGNEEKIIALIQLYKKAYRILALITLIVCLGLYPFLNHLMKDSGKIPFLSIIYFIFVTKSVVSYLNAHKWSLINADQRGYILAKLNLLFQVVTIITRIIILVTTKNYVFYLGVELIIFIVQNLINGHIVNKRYPYIKTKTHYRLDQSTKENLTKNVKGMFLQNIGGYLVFGTDNILISSFVSVAVVGLYSNYTMIISQLESLLSPILSGIGASVGNLLATENKEKNYEVFKVTFLMNFWIYSLCVVFLYNLLVPFISWWLGDQYLLNNLAFIFILINFYLNGMRTAIATFKNNAGLFTQDKYAPLVEGGINLISSLVFVKFFGLAGVFMGTSLSTVATILWTQPVITYKHVFKKPVGSYFIKYAFYACLTVVTCCITTVVVNHLVFGHSFLSLIERGNISLVVPNLLYVIIFSKNTEFKYLIKITRAHVSGYKLKLGKTQKVNSNQLSKEVYNEK